MHRLLTTSLIIHLALLSVDSIGTVPCRAGVVITKIVDTSQVYAIYPYETAISNNGSVAFLSTPASNSATYSAIMTGSGGALTTIATASNGYLGDIFAINGSGTVAYTAVAYNSTGPELSGVFTGNGGETTAIAGGYPGGNVSINNSGYVAFDTQAPTSTLPSQILLGNGGSLITIASGTPGQNDVRNPVVNNNGVVAFINDTTNTIYTGTGGQLTPIVGPANGFISGYTLSINDSGTVLFLGAFSNGASGYFTSNGSGTFTQVLPGVGAGEVNINNSGEIAYAAGNGILTVDNGVTTDLIAIGSQLDGSTVTSPGFGFHDLNDSGQVAFYASLADGQSGVFVASSAVPEPSSLLMLAIGALGMIGAMTRCRLLRLLV